MAYSPAVLQRAQRRLLRAKEQNERDTRARIDAIYAEYPRLREIDLALRQTAAHIMAVSFRTGADPQQAMQRLRQENLALQRERDWILESNDIDPEDLAETPICACCGGTGWRGAVMCDCLKELCRQEQKKELSTLLGAGRESFDRFRLDVYPEAADAQLGTSPRAVMQQVLRSAQYYARTFTPEAGSILMIGATGLGKTFLSACIARAVTDRGYSVAYVSAGTMFADFEQQKFHPQPDTDLTQRYLECDLLIIDDLGTEMTTQLVVAALYQVINTRLLEAKPCIVSTNLPVDELARRYSPQIASRLLGTYEVYKFCGRDIRLLMK